MLCDTKAELRVVFLIFAALCKLIHAKESNSGREFTLRAKGVDLPGPSMSFDVNLTLGTLQFTFKTYSSDALVLYQDDEGLYDYINLRLENGYLKFSFNIEDTHYTNTSRQKYDDFKWYTIRISRTETETKVILPKEPDLVFESFDKISTFLSPLQLGGFTPERYETSRNTITKQGALHYFLGRERRRRRFFNACVSNIMFKPYHGKNREAGFAHISDIKRFRHYAKQGNCTLTECDKPDPVCKNNGRCYIKDGKPHCDCRWTGFRKQSCTEPSLELSLNGTYRVTYRWNKLRPEGKRIIATVKDVIIFRIKTKQTSAPIFEIVGLGSDRLTMTLMGSRLVVTTQLGISGGRLSAPRMVTNQGISDGEWHRVNYTRVNNKYHLTIDDYDERRAQGRHKSQQLDFAENAEAHLGAMQDTYKEDVILQDFIWKKVSPHQDIYNVDFFEINLVDGLYESFKTSDPRFVVYPEGAKPRFNKKLPDRTDENAPFTRPTDRSSGTTECVETEGHTCPDATNEADGSTQSPKKSARSGDDGDDSSLTWIVVVTVICCLILFGVIAFFVYRWNKRYSGDFQVNKKEIGPAGTVVHYKDTGYKEKERASKI